MASLTCPNCGKDNPDFLDNCQFCQTALRREATLNIGEGPVKKSTGELEGVLPDWLKDARQQARDAAQEEAKKEATLPKVQKQEPLDLLAGLAFQSASDEEEVPDWLSAINPVIDKKPSTPIKADEPKSSDFFDQFNQQPVEETKPSEEPLPWATDTNDTRQVDELGGWMSQTAPSSSSDSTGFDLGGQDVNWLNNLDQPAASQQPAEDLGWLHDLEASSTPAPPAATPQADSGWTSNAASSSQEDLGWLNNLGGLPLDNSAVPQSAPSSQEDLSWLNNLDGTPVEEIPTSQPASSQEDLSWLNNLGGTPTEETPAAQSASTSNDDLGWLNNLGGTPAEEEPAGQSASAQEDLSWLSNLGGTSVEETPITHSAFTLNDDLGWLNNLGGTPMEEVPVAQPGSPQEDLSWLSNLGGTPVEEMPATQSATTTDDDLGWLNNLGGTPAEEAPAVQPVSPQEDLSWLSNLGGTPVEEMPATQSASTSVDDLGWLNNLSGTPAEETPAAQPVSPQEDLSWLSNLGGTPVEELQATQPASASDGDLDWLNNLGGTPVEEAPAVQSASSSQEDLSWLSNLGGTPAEETSLAQPETTLEDDSGWQNNYATASFDTSPTIQLDSQSQNDLGWLSNLNNEPTSTSMEEPQASTSEEPAMPDWFAEMNNPSKYSPTHTAPLSEEAVNNMPDWLKSATEEASMPPLNTAEAKDWFAAQEKPADELKFDLTPAQSQTPDFDQLAEKPELVPQEMPKSTLPEAYSSANEIASISNQDVDSLFAVDMPDWLTQSASETNEQGSAQGGGPAGINDSLSPVDLPSWVQAMRPVESVISDAAVEVADQPTEREGPLAGLSGVIPFAPVGSAKRPKPISLKLQASDEQQVTAALIEQIIASETTAHPHRAPAIVASQRTLRWVLTGLFLLVLGLVIGLGTQMTPITISNTTMSTISNMANTIQSIPNGSRVLVVINYDPALAGEMEAVAGPLLDQLVETCHPKLTFVSTSPNGPALVDRLLTDTKISQSVKSDYFNPGYLPGGLTGVRGFIEQPQITVPSIGINKFSDFVAVIMLTDQAETGQAWIEQVSLAKQNDPVLVNQPLLVVASAQAGPLLQPYVSSKQVTGMISGLADAVRFEYMNNSHPGIARTYWDAFGTGLFLAIISIIFGSLWNLISGFRNRRVEAENG